MESKRYPVQYNPETAVEDLQDCFTTLSCTLLGLAHQRVGMLTLPHLKVDQLPSLIAPTRIRKFQNETNTIACGWRLTYPSPFKPEKGNDCFNLFSSGYGERVSLALSLATIELDRNILSEPIKDNIAVMEDHYRDVVDKETFMESVKGVMREGVSTTAGVMSMFMVDKVEGFIDPIELMKWLISSGTLTRLSQVSPINLIVPMINNLEYFPEAIKMIDGQYKINERVWNAFKEKRNIRREIYPIKPGARQKGCPAGKRLPGNSEPGKYGAMTGVDYMAASLTIYTQRYLQLLAAVPDRKIFTAVTDPRSLNDIEVSIYERRMLAERSLTAKTHPGYYHFLRTRLDS